MRLKLKNELILSSENHIMKLATQALCFRAGVRHTHGWLIHGQTITVSKSRLEFTPLRPSTDLLRKDRHSPADFIYPLNIIIYFPLWENSIGGLYHE